MENESHKVAGLDQPVEILVDRWGIPHIYARSPDDLFFAQGFNAARDRLFQIDLWRRRGLGELAEVLGPSFVDKDRSARLLIYRGDMDAEWAAYGPDTKRIVTRFVDGVNAYVRWLDDHPKALPPEFEMLGYAPAQWSPEDVVRPRAHAPAANLILEQYRARIASVGDPVADRVWLDLVRGHTPAPAPDLDLDLPKDVLRDYLMATGPVQVPGGGGGNDGSNCWALAGSRTVSGRPLLASDPHRAQTAPSLRYIAHLSCPDFDIIGAGEPFMPGLALGHNGTAAFGFTIYAIDTEDLYVCDMDRELRRVVIEDIAVKGEQPRQVELEFDRVGPVLYKDVERGKVYILRSTWFEPGTSPYLGSLDYMKAKSWRQFEAGLATWRSPGENHLYADVNGTIASRAAGLVPRRKGHDGLFPVPADERVDWDGFLSATEFPGTVDPPEGFVASANEFNVPDHLPLPSYEWPDSTRRRRIVDVLSSKPKHSFEDMVSLQTDQRANDAQEILTLVRNLRPDDDLTAAAVHMLRSWDAVESVDSAAAVLYEIWLSRHLRQTFVQTVVSAEAAKLIPGPDPRVLREALAHPQAWFAGSDPASTRDDLLMRTLRTAYEDAVTLLGEDPAEWRWGEAHQSAQLHVLGDLDPELNVGPAPIGGSGSTVNLSAYMPATLSSFWGPSFRMIVDVGEWDNSLCINTPGQSGDPRSPHYRDLFDTWCRNEYVPMLYSRPAIERNVELRILLEPTNRHRADA
ncbi:penicillin acylase family protein [Flindersiella endophytica]